jgi:hypothetical protein
VLSITYVNDLDHASTRWRQLSHRGGRCRQTHLESQHANDAGLAWGHRAYTKSGPSVPPCPTCFVDAMVAHVADAPGDEYDPGAGRCAGRIPDDATAFTGRDAPF